MRSFHARRPSLTGAPRVRIPAASAASMYFPAFEQPLLRPLPDEPFETGRWFTPRVDRFSLAGTEYLLVIERKYRVGRRTVVKAMASRTLTGPVLQISPATAEDHQTALPLLLAHRDADRIGIGHLSAISPERVRPRHSHVPPGQSTDDKTGLLPCQRMAGDQP